MIVVASDQRSEAIQRNWIATPPSGARDDGKMMAHTFLMPGTRYLPS
jgi:hypothetical protein